MSHSPSPRRRKPTAKIKPGVRRVATGLAAVIAAAAVLTSIPTTARAADPIVTKGDILVTAGGGALTSGRVDKINPVMGAAAVAASISNDDPDSMAVLPNGDFIVAMFDGQLIRVDHLTGAQRTLLTVGGSVPWVDLAVGVDGDVLALLRDDSGAKLVSLDPQTGALTARNMPTLVGAQNLAVEWDGRVLVASAHKLLRVTPATGQTDSVASFSTMIRGLAVRRDSQIFVRTVGDDTTSTQLIRVDPVTNARTIVTSGDHLNVRFASNGMAFEDATNLVSAEDRGPGAGDGVVRINSLTGKQSVVFASDPIESQDIAVVGVSQIPPPPTVTANTDSFNTTTTATPLQVGTPGVLGNDTDPLKQKLTATLDGPAANQAGTIDLHADGSFTYTRAAGFEGTARFFYRAHAPGRTSATGAILIAVKPAGLPAANPDKFSMASQAGQLTGSVLGNDTDPLGQKLHAVVAASTLEHGFISFSSDGFFFYFPDTGFVGTETFDYFAIAQDGRTSERVTVTIQVINNAKPFVGVRRGGSIPAAGDNGTVDVGIADTFTPAAKLKVKATTSNPTLVPAGNVTIGAPFGQGGSDRLVKIVPVAGKTGSAVITITATDEFDASASTLIRVQVGGAGADQLTGTTETDLLLGGGGNDTLLGNAGIDLLGGGAGDDTLTGGTNADIFRGGTGLNRATDANAATGDVTFEIK